MARTILLKLSGEIFSLKNKSTINSIVQNIKQLTSKYRLGIVIGGGNFFKGDREGKEFNLNTDTGHMVGMLATMMNGMILQQLLEKADVKTALFSALQCPQIAKPINQHKIERDLQKNKCLIFSGGTGNPFFTTDTNAILRALQIDAKEVWKGSNVDGIYDADPNKNITSNLIKKISYNDVLNKKLKVMDLTAMTLASQNSIKIRVFNIFEGNSLIKASDDENWGSLVE